MRRRSYGGNIPTPPPPGDGGGGVVTPVEGVFTAWTTFDPTAPTWRDGTAITGDALTQWQRFYYRINKFLTAYSSGELDLTVDPYKIASNGGWGSYEIARGLRNWGVQLLQVVATVPWEGVPLLAVEVANRLLASRQSSWTPQSGFTNITPQWTESGHPFWAWKANDSHYYGTDLNPLDEAGVGASLAVWTRLLWENRHIPACATAASALFAHYRDHHVPKWVTRLAARGNGPKNLNKTTIPHVSVTSSHTWVGYLTELSMMEPVARDLDPTWAASKYDNLERGFDALLADTFTARWGQPYLNLTNRAGGLHTVQDATGLSYVWTGGFAIGDASSDSQGVARTNQYTAYTVAAFSLLNLTNPDVVTDDVMTRFAKTTRHRYWRVPASQVTSNGYTHTWGDHAGAWEDANGTDHVGSPIKTREGPTIPNIANPSYRRPPTPGHNTTHPFHHVAAWDDALLPYIDSLAQVMGSNNSTPKAFMFAADKLAAYGRTHIGSGGGGGGGGGTGPTLALSVSANGRFLVDDAGASFFVLADTAWHAYEFTEAEMDTYIADRKAKGFNTILGPVMWGAGRTEPGGYTNSTPAMSDNAYYLHVDKFVQKVAAAGLRLIIIPQWAADLANYSSDSQAYSYGAWLANRYAAYPGVMYFTTGEYASEGGLNYINRIKQIGLGMKSVSGTLVTVHPAGGDGYNLQSSSDYFHNESWLNFNSIQTWTTDSSSYNKVLADWNKTPTKPTFLSETKYEGESADALRVRRNLWHGVTSGSLGFGYGAYKVWRADSGWTANLSYPGASQMRYAKDLLASLPTPLNRVPDQTIIVSSNPSSDYTTYKTALRDSGGKWFMVYLPSGGSVTVNMTKITASGMATARWYNPRTGAKTTIDSGDTNNTAVTLTTPDSQDWLLLVEAN